VEVNASSLVSDAAREVGRRADQLIRDVQSSLRREFPDQWDDPEIAGMGAQGVADHVFAALADFAVDDGTKRTAALSAEVERAYRLARLEIPVSVLLRSLRIGLDVVVDRMLEQLPRLTDEPELVAGAARRLLSTVSEYADLVSEHVIAAYQEERERWLRGRLSILNDASVRIGTTLDIDRTTRELAEFGTDGFADAVTVDLLDSMLRGHGLAASGPLTVRTITRRSIQRDDPSPTAGPPRLRTIAGGSPQARALTECRAALSASTLVVPLRARESTVGVATFTRNAASGLFNDDDLVLAQEIASRAATAIDNARRYTHARAAALTLQRSLLPVRTAEQPAVQVACRYLPANLEAGVGGDWYDLIPLSGARVALVVGDVVGHGIHAAAAMGRLRTAVHTLADIDLPPDELLTHLDDVVLRLSAETSADAGIDTTGYIGATCLYAVYDPVSRRCSLARAGHVPPVAVLRDHDPELIDLPAGPPLGLGGLPFEAAEVELPEGSILALYTDGLVEGRDRDIEDGLALLRETLARPAASLEDTCDSVLEALLPDQPSDDVALLLVRTRALGAAQVADWGIDSDAAVVSQVRANVARQLESWGVEEFGFTAELVVSELVTNAIRYGRAPIRLRLILPERVQEPGGPGVALICEVSDTSNTTPLLRRARSFDEGGRGLLLVAQLSASWGTRHTRQGKTVWAELNESGESMASAVI
jgi:serine phosphatase RsbU (regulator of sigma subunit)